MPGLSAGFPRTYQFTDLRNNELGATSEDQATISVIAEALERVQYVRITQWQHQEEEQQRHPYSQLYALAGTQNVRHHRIPSPNHLKL